MIKQTDKYKFVNKLKNEEEYQELAGYLLEFAQQDNSLDINAFPLSLMINPDDFTSFTKHSAYFANAYNTAMHLIGARLKQLMYEGAIDRQFALEMLPLYDQTYRQYLIEKRQRDETAGQTKIITVMMPSFISDNVQTEEQEAEKIITTKGIFHGSN